MEPPFPSFFTVPFLFNHNLDGNGKILCFDSHFSSFGGPENVNQRMGLNLGKGPKWFKSLGHFTPQVTGQWRYQLVFM